jgi:DNA repair photolyase
MIMVRLPGEVRDIFREWLLQNYPDKVRHVMSLVRDVRDGKDNDARWGTRFTGEGPYAVLMQQRFEKARTRYGLDEKMTPLRTDLFVHPEKDDAQLALF